MDQNSLNTQPTSSVNYSGLSGNELYCARLLGFTPGDLVIGNSVFSMGLIGSLRANVKTFIGGELTAVTNMIAEGRRLSFDRFQQELANGGGTGALGVSNELVFHPGNAEFLSVGSIVHSAQDRQFQAFTTSSDGQELFCQWDAGYQPLSFVFGNVAYSIGAAKGVMGSFRQLAKGEVKQYSDIFNTTRNLALNRICQEAQAKGANSVVGIKTSILPVQTDAVHEMVMIGTASLNPAVNELAAATGGITSSDLTAEETWNITQLGYAPVKLLLGTSVYSLGFVGGIKAGFGNLVKGEIKALTDLIYGAREESLKKVKAQAEEINADDVLGIKTYIYDLGGGLIEFLAIGTAVKKIDGLSSRSQQLPAQAIIRDKDTFFNTADMVYGVDLQRAKPN